MRTIKAIPTTYRGQTFRSRTEARWAVVFHTLGIHFEYEKEGYDLPSGRYLPDFYLPKQYKFPDPMWIEIKPSVGIVEDSGRLEELCLYTKTRGMFLSSIPQHDCDIHSWGYDQELWINLPYTDDNGKTNIGGDFPYLLCQCRKCRSYGFEFDGRSWRIGCPCEAPNDQHPDKGYSYDAPQIVEAYRTANFFRFW